MMGRSRINLAVLAFFALLPLVMPVWALGDFAIYFTYAIFATSLAWARMSPTSSAFCSPVEPSAAGTSFWA